MPAKWSPSRGCTALKTRSKVPVSSSVLSKGFSAVGLVGALESHGRKCPTPSLDVSRARQVVSNGSQASSKDSYIRSVSDRVKSIRFRILRPYSEYLSQPAV